MVPAAMRKQILEIAHESHPGIVRTKRQLRRTYWWPGMDNQIEQFVRYCSACQESAKSHKPTRPPLTRIEPPMDPWHKIAIDICGPFANAPRHQRFITVVIDYATCYPEILLSGDITSGRIICWLTEVFARFGNPDIIVSDNGPQFTSTTFTDFLKARDIFHWTAAVYNPQQNGKVEAFNRYLKQGVQTFCAARKNFAMGLQELLFSFRTTSSSADGQSPAELMFHRRLRTNFEPAQRRANSNHDTPVRMETRKASEPEQHPPVYRGPYKLNDMVCVRLPHVPKGFSPFLEPRRVTAVLGHYTYRLTDGQIWNARRLVRVRQKPPPIFVERGEEASALPLRQSTRATRGRPPIHPHTDSTKGR